MDVVQIRQMATSLSLSQIAKQFGITQPNVKAIVAGKTWKHVGTACEFEDSVVS